VFTEIRRQAAHWIAYRRAPLAATQGLPLLVETRWGRRREPVAHAAELVAPPGYSDAGLAEDDPARQDRVGDGLARQITVFAHGAPVAQILTSDRDSCALALLPDLHDRWRIENRIKYDRAHYGTDRATRRSARRSPG
jgi:hypothetical protein